MPLEMRDQLVHERPRRLALGLGGAGDLLAVLVGAGQEERGVAALAVEARQGVGQQPSRRRDRDGACR